MNKMYANLALSAALLLSMTACGKKDNSVEPPSAQAAPVIAPAASGGNPLPGVVAADGKLPDQHTGVGPAHGSTAIGGVTGNQEAGGQSSTLPQPTAGDGAASGAAK